MSNPSAIAEARRLVADAVENLAARRAVLNRLLPELPADWTYKIGDVNNFAPQMCPHVDEDNGAPCGATVYAYAATDEVSPVLGWAPSEILSWNDETRTMTSEGEVTALWLADYDWGDQSDPIHAIQCGNGHAWRVPEHTDRDV